jgi:membrane protein implicated in regulation of membrane protease activity
MSVADRQSLDKEANGQRSVGQLIAAATADLSELVHDEIALAKKELKKDLGRGLIGGASFSAAGVIFLASIPMFSFAAAYGLQNIGIPLWSCFLIVGAIFVILAGIAAFLAARAFKKVKPPQKTIASTKATVDVLKKAKPHPAVAGPDGQRPAIEG